MCPRVDVQNAPDALGVTAGQVPLDGQDGTQVALAGKERVPSVRPAHQQPCSHPSPAPRLLAGATGPGSQCPCPRGCPVLLNPLCSGGTGHSASRRCQAPAQSSLGTGCSSQNARPQALEGTSSFSPLSA